VSSDDDVGPDLQSESAMLVAMREAGKAEIEHNIAALHVAAKQLHDPVAREERSAPCACARWRAIVVLPAPMGPQTM
jgi:hypothetical protein